MITFITMNQTLVTAIIIITAYINFRLNKSSNDMVHTYSRMITSLRDQVTLLTVQVNKLENDLQEEINRTRGNKNGT
jgi:hypothetical protein